MRPETSPTTWRVPGWYELSWNGEVNGRKVGTVSWRAYVMDQPATRHRLNSPLSRLWPGRFADYSGLSWIDGRSFSWSQGTSLLSKDANLLPIPPRNQLGWREPRASHAGDIG